MTEKHDRQKDEAASWRCFIAIDISAEVREAAARMQAKFRRVNADVSFPDPANMHLTLIFLGDTLTGKIGAVKNALDAAAAGVKPFDLPCAGLGFFGPPRHPRVLWAGAGEPPPELSKLHERLLAIITELGFSIEKRPFRPHLTLGRIRSGRGLDGLTAAVDSHRETVFGGSHVERVLLMRSHLDQPRAKYTILHEALLKGT